MITALRTRGLRVGGQTTALRSGFKELKDIKCPGEVVLVQVSEGDLDLGLNIQVYMVLW